MLLLFNALIALNASAQEEKILTIDIYDYDTAEEIKDDIFFEGKKYDIVVGYNWSWQTGWETGFAYNATVTIPYEPPSIISEEMPWVTTEAPKFEDYPDGFIITASVLIEDDPLYVYIPAEREIVVLKGELSITKDRETVEEQKSFSVTVTEKNSEEVVEEAIVFLSIDGNEGDSSTTNIDGKAYLYAPEVNGDVKVNITAFKEGYNVGRTTIRVENIGPGFIDADLAPIIMAVIVVIFAILFVKLRKKRSRPKSGLKTNTVKEKQLDKIKPKKIPLQTKHEGELPLVDNGPRVEEIRIRGQDKKKETEHISDKKEPEKATIPRHKKGDYEWFKGEDYMRYKIDELTGEIDGQKADKWFEGTDDIRSKVDEKLKKKHKKRDK